MLNDCKHYHETISLTFCEVKSQNGGTVCLPLIFVCGILKKVT